jgi:hypothetical protein
MTICFAEAKKLRLDRNRANLIEIGALFAVRGASRPAFLRVTVLNARNGCSEESYVETISNHPRGRRFAADSGRHHSNVRLLEQWSGAG